MPFKSVRFASFRNLVDGELDTTAERIFLVGENGQGKTNFLEALYYLSFGSSFRGNADSETARTGERTFVLSAMATSFSGDALPAEEVRVEWENGTKSIRRAGKRIQDRKELIETNPAVVFCHEDFAFAAGEPERRRFFFDQTASLVSVVYIESLREYKRILRQRNAALKERRIELLDLFDEQLVTAGISLVEAREDLEAALMEPFSALYEDVSKLGKRVSLEYRPSWKARGSRADVIDYLHSRRSDDLSMGTSLSGPHRDRWAFRSDDRDFTATASTGQLRLLSLVLRSLQARHYMETVGKKPVLLLDDVLLEIDPEKRKRFFLSLPESSQAFFTFLPGEHWEDYRSDSMIVYRVADGRFSH